MGRSMSKRQERVREEVLARGEVEFSGLAASLGVSEMTIRRDIDALEAEGVVRKVIGGAIALGKIAEPSFEARSHLDAGSKLHIAEAVVKQLSMHETVILDSGSTALAVARAVRGRSLSLTIVTPSLLVAVELAGEPNTNVLVTGGAVRPGELSLIGAEAVESLERFNCDTYVMGVAGVHEQRGYTDYHREESAVKRAAISASDRLIVAVDQSKIGRAYLSTVAPLSRAYAIVSDADPDSPVLTAASHAGVQIIIAEPFSDLVAGPDA